LEVVKIKVDELVSKEDFEDLEKGIKRVLDDSFRLMYADGGIDDDQYISTVQMGGKLKILMGKDLWIDVYLEDYFPYFKFFEKNLSPGKEKLKEKYMEFKELEKRFED
jgi:hypothetical protein